MALTERLCSNAASATASTTVGLRPSLDQISLYYSFRQFPELYAPDMQTVVFFLLKTDLIHAFYAGVLPSFATCISGGGKVIPDEKKNRQN